MGILKGAVSGSGRFVPSKVVVSYTGSGQFTIQNYNSSYIYTLSNPSATRVGSVVTLPSSNMSTTISARSPKGSSDSSTAYAERKSYSYSGRTVPQSCCDTYCYYVGSCACGPTVGGQCVDGSRRSGECGCGGATPCLYGTIPYIQCDQVNCRDCSYTVYDVLIDQSANGYINNGTDWHKVA